jgi:Tfp pilus assembly protein PilF
MRGWWLAAGLLLAVTVAAVVVLGVWAHPPPWLRGPRELVIAVLQWVRVRWLTSGAADVAATLVVFWWQRRREDKRARLDRERRDRETQVRQARLLQAHCRVDEASGWLPRVGELTDPVALGVHPATPISQVSEESQVPAGGVNMPGRAPVYVPRDVDARLDAALAQDGLVLLRGDSMAGKSRAAFEAMRRLPDAPFVLIPTEHGSLRALLDAGFGFQDTVVWLDDLERFLGPGGLDTALLHRLVRDGTRRVVVLATMRASEYNRRDPAGGRDATGAERDLLRADRELLDQAIEDLALERRFTPAEQQRAMERAWDPRIADALKRAGRYGLAEYVAAGPRLWRRWRNARAVDSPLPERVGAALVAAAIDCRRAGLSRSVPESVLRDLLAVYLEDEPGVDRLDSTVVADGLTWATERLYATSALLTHKDDGWIAFDYLLDQVETDANPSPVTPAVWKRLLPELRYGDAWSVGIAASRAGQQAVAERAFRMWVHHKPEEMTNLLAVLLAQQGLPEEAERWYRQAAEADHPAAAYNLGMLLLEQGRLEEAEQWLRRAVEGKPAGLATHPLGVVLAQQGQLEEAEQWLRKAATGIPMKGRRSSQYDLGVVLARQGRAEEAKEWFRRAARAGEERARAALASMDLKQPPV